MKKLSLLAAFAAACSLSAETLSVISNADSGEGTLRGLIEVVAEGDVLEIPEGMTITLDTPVVLPGVSFDIIGLGVGATIQGDGTHTLFTAGNKKTVRKIGFRNITVTKGANQTAATAAGGAFNITGLSDANDDLSLVFNDCRFTDNRNAHTSVGAVFTHSFGGRPRISPRFLFRSIALIACLPETPAARLLLARPGTSPALREMQCSLGANSTATASTRFLMRKLKSPDTSTDCSTDRLLSSSLTIV